MTSTNKQTEGIEGVLDEGAAPFDPGKRTDKKVDVIRRHIECIQDIQRKLLLISPAVEDKAEREHLDSIITDDLPQLLELTRCR